MRSALVVAAFLAWLAPSAGATCASPANRVEAENCLPGAPKSQWYPSGAGDTTIQGFPTDISVNAGGTISFKIKSTAAPYHINIYRMGYYGGLGARLQAIVSPSARFPQSQPACYNDPATHAIDCGAWGISATWVVPSTATSGIYLARLVRNDTGGSTVFQFVVREDSRHSDILFQHSDTTYQGYNLYGGYSFYHGPTGRAYAVSFNRPPADNNSLSSLWAHEQPLIRFLEANGYDVAYFTETDTDRRGALLRDHKLFVSAGHDEYVTGGVRANIEAARAAGVHLAFWTGNDLLWKARWGASFDASHTPYRTLLCYKETKTGRIDPADPPTWTGFWRDPAGGPPDDARPENALTGTLPIVENSNGVNDDTMLVPAEDAKLRFWRGTRVSTLTAGQTASFPELLGYEYDGDRDNGYRPPGLISMSSSTYFKQAVRQPDLSLSPGWNTHALSLYKASSGALVFGAGSMQWGWGLDSGHMGGHTAPDPALRQAAVNLLADMGAQPVTLQSDLKRASASTDFTAPVSRVTTPPQTYGAGAIATISGTAADAGGGVVAAVEVSTDSGVSWHPAAGRENWHFSWTQKTTAFVTPRSRAADDSGNLEGSSSVPPPPPPALASIAPSSAPAGGPGFTLDVFGSGFASSSTVLWSGGGRATVFLSTAHLTAAIPAADLAKPATAFVSVSNPGAGASNALAFVVFSTAAPPPPPAVSSIAPSSAPAGSPGFTLEVLGSGFVSSSTVLWSGSPRATVAVSTSHLQASIADADVAAATTAAVSVSNSGVRSNAVPFVVFSTFTAPPPAGLLFEDDFAGPNGLITNAYAYSHPTTAGIFVSSTWTVTNGSWFRDNGAAWTGVPDNAAPNINSSNGTGSAVFRVMTKRADFGDEAVSLTLVTQGFVTTPTTPSQPYDGVTLELRYSNDSSYYAFSIARRDNLCVLKKMAAGTLTTLAQASCVVPLDSAVSFQAVARGNADGSVSLQLSRAGATLFAVTDAGAGGTPLRAPAALGFRGNNANFRVSAFTVSASSAASFSAAALRVASAASLPEQLNDGEGPPSAPAAPAPSAAPEPRAYPNPWRADRNGGRPVTIDGLSDHGSVRVYTVSGRLVRALDANNGAVTWNLDDASGAGVGSGVYLYLILDDGSPRARGVIAVLR